MDFDKIEHGCSGLENQKVVCYSVLAAHMMLHIYKCRLYAGQVVINDILSGKLRKPCLYENSE